MVNGKSSVAVEFKRTLAGLTRKVAEQGETIRCLRKRVAELELQLGECASQHEDEPRGHTITVDTDVLASF